MNLKRIVESVLPHAGIIIAGMLITFLIIDHYYTAMAFINNDMTKGLLGAFCIITFLNCILLIHKQRNEE